MCLVFYLFNFNPLDYILILIYTTSLKHFLIMLCELSTVKLSFITKYVAQILGIETAVF